MAARYLDRLRVTSLDTPDDGWWAVDAAITCSVIDEIVFPGVGDALPGHGGFCLHISGRIENIVVSELVASPTN